MNHPFPFWDSTVNEIADWAAPDGHVRIGHIQGPHATGKSLYLPRALWSALTAKRHNTTVFHAVSDSELYRLSTVYEQPGPAGDWHREIIHEASQRHQKPVTAMQVAPYLNLRVNLAGQGVGENPVEDYLMAPVVFIVDLELHCSANLALLLVTLMTWAFPPAASSASQSVTIFTMSANEPPRHLVDLLSVYSQNLRPFVLPLPPFPCLADLNTTISEFTDAATLAEAVEENVQSAMIRRAVVVLNPSDCLEAICSRLVSEIRHVEQPVSGSDLGLQEYGERIRRNFVMEPLEPCIRMVYIPRGDRWHVRCDPSGIEEMHLVLSLEAPSTIFDPETGQMVETMMPLSWEERQEVLSWVKRSGARRCYLYVLGHDAAGSGFFSRGEEHRHWDVGNHQALGFVASLISLQQWVVDMIPIVRCFMPENLALEAIRRCWLMGILTDEQDSQGRITLSNCVPDVPFSLLQALIPVCDFDIRAAFLLALPTDEPSVGSIKVDLAAIASVGVGQVFSPWRYPGDDDMRSRGEVTPVDWSDVFRRSCSNSASHIVKWGSVGALVGLWREVMSRTRVAGVGLSSLDERSRYSEDSNMNQLAKGNHCVEDARYYLLFIPHLNFGLDTAGACRVWCLRKEILRIMDDFGVPVDTRDYPETCLPEKEQHIFQMDLLSTFIHGLGQVKMTDGLLEIEDYVSGHMAQPHDEVSKMVGWQRNWELKKKGPLDMVLGLRIDPLRREKSGKLTFKDWTWIPTSAVADWRSSIYIPEVYSITASLRTRHLSQGNAVEEPEHP